MLSAELPSATTLRTQIHTQLADAPLDELLRPPQCEFDDYRSSVIALCAALQRTMGAGGTSARHGTADAPAGR